MHPDGIQDVGSRCRRLRSAARRLWSTRSASSPSCRRNRSVRALTTTCTPAASAAARSAPTSSAWSADDRSRLPSPCTVSSMFSPTAPASSRPSMRRAASLAVSGLDIHGDGDLDGVGDLHDAGEQFIECHALAIRLADRVGNRMAAKGQRRKACVDGELRRPRVPYRRQHHRVARLVQREQGHCPLLKNLLFRHVRPPF